MKGSFFLYGKNIAAMKVIAEKNRVIYHKSFLEFDSLNSDVSLIT